MSALQTLPRLSFAEFAHKYCTHQESTPEQLAAKLRVQQSRYQPVGWMLLECVDLSSSRRGELTVLPYGPNNTFQEPSDRPLSPRGIASDMSTVCAHMLVEDLPEPQG